MQTEKITHHIIDWLIEYVKQSRQKGFILGVSGGIDSSVVSALCAKTDLPLLCLEMPIHQNVKEANKGKRHLEWLKNNFDNVSSQEVDLTGVYDEFNHVVSKSDNQSAVDLALANTRARLRMSTLYYYAGLNGYLVAGTGNKVEDFGIGFFTKYGDGGVDISPIGDLMKSEVREIGRYLGLNDEIIVAKPTDGLFDDNRSDEDQIGATYDELEWAMKIDERGESAENFTERQSEVYQIYKQRHKANLHKMKPIPVCEIPEEWKKKDY